MKRFDLKIGTLDKNQILRCLNYDAGLTPNPKVLNLLDDFCHQAGHIEKMRGAYTLIPIEHVETDGVLTGKGFIKSRQLAGIAAKSSQMAFCLVTAGALLDQKIESSSDILNAYLWDALGTVMVENAVTALLDRLRQKEKSDSSLPFSPGYCDWDLEGQKLIFSAFDPHPIGIHLQTDSLMMVPQKSIAFISCLGVDAIHLNPCRLCGLKKCFMRR